jgi:transposase
MSARTVRPIPEDTASAGKAFFEKGAFYRNVGDQLDELCRDCAPDPRHSASDPHIAIPMLFLITVFQYLENLSDSQATAAVLNRVDWKYALHLPLISLGFEQNELDEYHRQLSADPTVLQCLNGLLERVRNLYDSHPKDLKKADTVSMLDAVHTLNRFSQMVRAMRLALDELAIYHPEWLKRMVLPHWFHRYARSEAERTAPETLLKRQALALAVGEDGFFLLDALEMKDAPPEASNLPEVEYFRHVWSRHLKRTKGKIHWRMAPGPCAG